MSGLAAVLCAAALTLGHAATSRAGTEEVAPAEPSSPVDGAAPPGDDASSSYTGRLLKAKRRALNRNDKDEKKD